jgi:hypothetical protein
MRRLVLCCWDGENVYIPRAGWHALKVDILLHAFTSYVRLLIADTSIFYTHRLRIYLSTNTPISNSLFYLSAFFSSVATTSSIFLKLQLLQNAGYKNGLRSKRLSSGLYASAW